MNDIIEVYKNDSATIQVDVTDSNDAAFDLTGYTAKLTIRKSKTSAIVLQIDGTINSPLLGVIIFDITKEQMNLTPLEYVYDMQITNGTNVKTLKDSTFKIIQDVTY
jgi:hypothetical protein